jgi:hypothetical protein
MKPHLKRVPGVAGLFAGSDGSSMLTETQCVEILRRLAQGEFQTRLAAEFGVGVGTIHNLKSGHTWAHLTTTYH